MTMSAAPLAHAALASDHCRGSAQHRFGRRCPLTVLATVALSACTISPQPVPPPEPETLAIQPNLISVSDDGLGNVLMHGEPGAVTPGAQVLRTLDRITPSPAIEVGIAADGSFDVALVGLATDSFRLQARKDFSYSPPVDVQGNGTGPVYEIAPPYGGCVVVEPSREIAFPTTPIDDVAIAPMRVWNTCPFDISISSLTLLSGNGEFEPLMGTSTSGFVAMGGQVVLGVAFHPTIDGLHEDDLMVQFVAQPPEIPQDPALLPTWVLTVRGMATP